MHRGTTPTLCLAMVTTLDLNRLSDVWVTLRNPSIEMTLSGENVHIDTDAKKAYVSLTQEQTLSFSVGKVKVQARLLMDDGKAFATDIQEVPIEAILMEGVICHDPDESEGDGEPDPDDG